MLRPNILPIYDGEGCYRFDDLVKVGLKCSKRFEVVLLKVAIMMLTQYCLLVAVESFDANTQSKLSRRYLVAANCSRSLIPACYFNRDSMPDTVS
jgi:hypothetical protein